MRRWPGLTLAVAGLVAGLLAGCSGSDAPFFVVRNDRPADLHVTYCATQACPLPVTRLVRTDRTWRVTNTSGPNSGGYLFITLAGRREGCVSVAPAITMVDRLYAYPISTFIANSCAGYNPARRLRLPIRTSRGSFG
jgi:hypothetical protein